MLASIPIDRIETGYRLRGISAGQVAALVDSIGDVGLLNPITVYCRSIVRGGVTVEGYGLVAGAHRLRACEQLGLVDIEAHIVVLGELERQIAECDENLCSTKLTAAEKAMFTRRRKAAYEALHPETKHGATGGGHDQSRQVGDSADRFTADTAAKTGESERAVQRNAERGQTISERALETLRGTHLDKGVYLDELKRLPEDEQIHAVERDLEAARETLAMAKEIRAARASLRHKVLLAHMDMVAEKGRTMAPAKLGKAYPVYYLDPPWRFAVRSEVTGREKSAENHYPTATTDELVDLLPGLIGGSTPAVCFMWATNPMLQDALRVLEACGFTYVHHWIWDKEVPGTGYWGRDQHELLMIGRRGDIAAPLPGTQPATIYREKKGRHSAKPAHFAETIERLYPGIARIELFARSARPGWDAWGFEVEQTAATTLAAPPHPDTGKPGHAGRAARPAGMTPYQKRKARLVADKAAPNRKEEAR